jgi:endoglucanase
MDRSFIADRRLVHLLVHTADREAIPHQLKQPGIGGTDAGAIHLSRAGVPAAVVSVPCRYIHGPVGLMSLNDFDNLVALMKATLHALPDAWHGPNGW